MMELAEALTSTLLAAGATLVEVYLKEGWSVRSHLSANGTRTTSAVLEDGIAIRAWNETGREAFATWALPDEAAEQQGLRLLSEQLAGRGESDGPPDLPASLEIDRDGALAGFTARAPEIDLPETARAAEAVLAEVAGEACGPDRAAVRLAGAWCEAGSNRTLLCNSRGLRLVHVETGWHLTLSVCAGRDSGARLGFLGRRAPSASDLRAGDLLQGVSWRTAAGLGAEGAPVDRGTVLLDGALSSQLLAHMAPAFIAGERSVQALREEAVVGPAGVGIVEEGHRAGEASWDGEGAPRRRTVLVSGGRLVGLLTDTASATRYGLPKTGSARRLSFRDRPAAAPHHLSLTFEGGEASLEGLFQRLAPGMFVTTARFFPAESASGGLFVGAGIWMDAGRVLGPAGAMLPIAPMALLERLRGAEAEGTEWIEGARSGALLIALGR